ncbi:MAG: LPS export ABC transporter permease LptF [Gammaproteobacteria bacterium]
MILSRYLVKEILVNTAAVTLVLVLVGIMNQFVVFLGRAAAGQFPVSLLLEIVALNIPFLLSFMLPFGFFLGVLLGFGRLYAESEMTVMLACGFSVSHLVWVTLVTSIGLAILCGVLTIWTTPAAMKRLEVLFAQVKTDVLANFIIPGRFQTWENGHYVVYIGESNEQTREVKQIFIAEQPEKNSEENLTNKPERLSVLTAQTGYLWEDPKNGAEYIVLKDGKRYLGTAGELEYTLMNFGEYGVRLPSQSLYIPNRTRARPTSSFIGSSDLEEQSELQWRLTLPFSILIIAIVSVPLSRVAPRKGKFSTLFPAMVAILIYTNCLMLTRNWVENGLMNKWVGLAWPHLAALAFAGLLLAKQTNFWQRLFSKTSAIPGEN